MRESPGSTGKNAG